MTEHGQVPQNYKLFRRAIYAMCFVILGLGFAVVFVWIFQCQPLMSNFSYGVQRSWCADFNAVRYCRYWDIPLRLKD